MPFSRYIRTGLLTLAATLCCSPLFAAELSGDAVQGGLIFGRVDPGSRVQLDDTNVMVSPEGEFVIRCLLQEHW